MRLTENDMVAYTYAIHWTKYNKSYYGIRYARGCRTSDLWTKYFTSSDKVKEFRKQYGEPDIILIDQMFTDISEALDYEKFVLQENDVRKNLDWINTSDNTGLGAFGEKHHMHDPEVKRKVVSKRIGQKCPAISEAKKGIPNTKISGDNNPSKRPEVRQKISEKMKGRKVPWATGDNHWMKRPEVRERISGENHRYYGKIIPHLHGDNHHSLDRNVYVWVHLSGIVEELTRSQLQEKYDVPRSNLSSLISGKIRSNGQYVWSVKGWRCVACIIK